MADVTIVGGGLAGSEAAWQAAQRGLQVDLYEMRPDVPTGAHVSGNLAELVCSNSLGSNLPDRSSGLLKEELRRLGSMLLAIAEQTAVPAGAALAVDREQFSHRVTQAIARHPKIRLHRREYPSIPNTLAIIASGPLTSPSLAKALQNLSGEENLFFYDAIAPVVKHASIDMQRAFRASRYDRSQQEDGDYINCPFSRAEYEAFVSALTTAERIPLRDFESVIDSGVKAGAFFEGCLPIEVLAARGHQALAFGPLRPIGLRDPNTGKRPFAVLQLRQDNLAGTLYNLVGFQTNLTYPEQKRVFRLIPGLQDAEYVRFGQMHRNTFIASPLVLQPTLQSNHRHDLLFTGQITGVEGYLGNIATGLLAGLNAARLFHNQPPLALPPTTMLGALCYYVTHASMKDFQPMKANFGILPLPDNPERGKRERATQYVTRALRDLDSWIQHNSIERIPTD